MQYVFSEQEQTTQ